MPESNNNKFSIAARTRLIQLGWTIQKLADTIKRPRPSVSIAIHTERFPNVRKQVARKLNLKEAA